MFNFSYVGTVQLERCGGGGVGTAPASVREAAQAELARQADLLAREAAANPAPPAAAEPPAAPRAGGPPQELRRRQAQAAAARAARHQELAVVDVAVDAARAIRMSRSVPRRSTWRPSSRPKVAPIVPRDLAEKGQFGQALQAGVTDPTWPQRQTSLIMDPPDGRLPALTPEGNRRMMLMRSSWAWVDW